MAVVGEAFVRVRPQGGTFVAETTEQVKGGLGKISNLLGLGLAIGVAEVLKKSLSAADEFEKAESRLKIAIKDTGGQFDLYRGQIDKANTQGQKFGHSNAEIEDALAQLTLRTGSAKTAIKDLSLVEDVSAGLHKDLSSTIVLIAKAEAGSSTALKRLGINFQSTGDKAKDAAAIIKLLGERFAGQAQSQAETFAGKMAALRAEMTNIEQKIGLALIPVIETLGTAIGNTIEFVARNKTAFEVIGGVITVLLLPALEAYTVKQAIAFGEGAVKLVVGLGEKMGLLVVATEAVTTAEGEAAVAAGLLDGVSLAGLTGSLAAVAAAAAPLAVLAGGFLVLKHQLDDNKKTAASWADAHIAAAKRTGNELVALEAVEKHEVSVSNEGWHLKLGPVNLFSDEHARRAADRRKDIEKEIASLKASRDEASTVYKDITNSQDGATASATLLGVKLSDLAADPKGLKALETEAKKFADVTISTFHDSEGAIANFVKAGGTSFAQFTQDLNKQTKDDAKFAEDLLYLVDHGVTGPIITSLQSIGPAALPAAENMIAQLKAGSTNPQKLAELAAAGDLIAKALNDPLVKQAFNAKNVGLDVLRGILSGLSDPTLITAIINQSQFTAAQIYGTHVAHNKSESPSKLYRDKVGKPIIQGIIVGMQQELAGFDGKSIPSRLHDSILGGLGGLGGRAGGGGGITLHPGAVVVHVPPGATKEMVTHAGKTFEGAMARVLVRARMGAGQRG